MINIVAGVQSDGITYCLDPRSRQRFPHPLPSRVHLGTDGDFPIWEHFDHTHRAKLPIIVAMLTGQAVEKLEPWIIEITSPSKELEMHFNFRYITSESEEDLYG